MKTEISMQVTSVLNVKGNGMHLSTIIEDGTGPRVVGVTLDEESIERIVDNALWAKKEKA